MNYIELVLVAMHVHTLAKVPFSLNILRRYTVSISLTSTSGSDRFVADKSCS